MVDLAVPGDPPHRRAVIVSASVGAGHDGAARQLAHGLAGAGFAVDRYDFLDLLPSRLGPALCRAYAMELRRVPRTWEWLLRGLERNPRLTALAGLACARLSWRRLLAAVGPDAAVVVSTHHFASQAIGWLRRTERLTVPAVTFLTDMSVHPMWVAPGIDLHLALHDVPAGQARALGAPVVARCRPAVDPAFEQPGTRAERAATRAAYGIPVHAPVALVTAGSWGVGEVAEAARDILASGVATPVTVCGRNQDLRAELERHGLGTALGWVDDMPALMRASDVVVQNAGGLTSLEAMACGVPVVSYRCLPGHGTTNAAALAEAGLTPWPRDPQELGSALKAALTGDARLAEASDLFAAPAAVDAIGSLLYGITPMSNGV